MQLFNNATKAVEEVPDDQAQEAFTSGSHAFIHPDQPVPIKLPDGTIGTVPASGAQDAIEKYGASVIPQAEYHAADIDARYGGIGGALEATGEGVARGLLLGLPDPLAIGAARAIGGEQAAQATRAHLAGVKEAHPWLSGGGEIVGAVAPVLLSGGAAAPEEAAVLGGERLAAGGAETLAAGAGAFDRIGAAAAPKLAASIEAEAAAAGAAPKLAPELEQAAQTFHAAEGAATPVVQTTPSLVRQILSYTPAGLTSRLGSASGIAANEILGAKVGSSALGRVAAAGLRAAASGSAEGAVYGAAGQWDEDVLGNADHNAQKLVAAAGHGALMGFLLGGGGAAGIASAGEVAAPLLRRAAPYLDNAAGWEFWRALDPLKKWTKEAEKRAGGVRAVGKTGLREINLAGLSLGEAAMTPEELAPRIHDAARRKGLEIGDFLRRNGAKDTSIDAGHVLDAIDETIDPLRKKALHEGIVASLDDSKTSLLRTMGISEETQGLFARGRLEAEALGHKPGTAGFLEARAKYVDDQIVKMVGEGKAVPKTRVGLMDLLDQRRSLDKIAYIENRALDPKLRVEYLREMRGRLATVEEDAIDAQAKRLGLSETGRADYKAIKRDYQHLSLMQNAVDDTTARMATNRSLSLSDNMWGVGAFGGALASGHPMTAIPALASGYAHKYIRTHGNALAAWALARLSKLDLVARATKQVDGELEHAAASMVGGRVKPRVRVRRFNGPEPEAGTEEKREHLGQPAQVVTQEHLDAAFGDMSAHMPKTSSALLRTLNAGAAYIGAHRSQALNGISLLDPKAPPRHAAADVEASYRVAEAVHDPVGVLTRAMQTGRLPADQHKAITDNYPALVTDTQRYIMAELAKPHEPIPYDRAAVMEKILGAPVAPTQSGKAIALYQTTYAPTAPQPPTPQVGAPAGGKKGGTKPIKGIAEKHMLSLQKITR